MWLKEIVTMPLLTLIRPKVICTWSGHSDAAGLPVAPPVIALLLLVEVCVALAEVLGVADAVAAVLPADDALEPDADAAAC